MNLESEIGRGGALHRVWHDEAVRALLLEDPRQAAAAHGGSSPEEVEVRVVQDSASVAYLHIPAAPVEGEVTDGDLLAVQGGGTTCYPGWPIPCNPTFVPPEH